MCDVLTLLPPTHPGAGGAGPQVQVQVVGEEEMDGEPEPGASPVEFSTPSSAVTSAASEGLRAEELWVDEPTGAISAR
jgi:hypothetical protein